MTPFEMIKGHMSASIPFASHVGVVIEEVADGTARTTLEQRTETSNHIASQHAGALFTLGEAASGAAMAGGFVEMMMQIRPVAAKAEIAYTKVSKGKITAHGEVRGDVSALKAELNENDRVQFPVHVSMTDEEGNEVATMSVDWHLKKVA